jgi:hypothetical protein
MGPATAAAGGDGGGAAVVVVTANTGATTDAAATAGAAATAAAAGTGAAAGATAAVPGQTKEELTYRRHCDAAFRLDLCRLILLKSHYPKLMKMDMQLGVPPPRAVERGFAPTSASLDTYLGVKRSHVPLDQVVSLNTDRMPAPPQADDEPSRAAAPASTVTAGSRPSTPPPAAAAAAAAGGQPRRRSANDSRSPSPAPVGGAGRFALLANQDEKDEKA